MRVGFAGTPEFAATALQALLHHGFEVPLVLTQADRPAGRGMRLASSAVKQIAMARGIEVLQPLGLRLEGPYAQEALGTQARLRAARLDVMVVVAYGLLLPQWVLDAPARGCLNIHASLLPRWRGAAPIQRAIEAGDACSGVCIVQMDAGLDTGEILMQRRVPIEPHDSSPTLHAKLALLGGELIVQTLQTMQQAPHSLRPQAQASEGVCYAHKITRKDSVIDWQQSAGSIVRKVRALTPAPACGMDLVDVRGRAETIRILEAQGRGFPDGRALPPGSAILTEDGRLAIAASDGLVVPTMLQRPGGRRMPAAEFLRGYALKPAL